MLTTGSTGASGPTGGTGERLLHNVMMSFDQHRRAPATQVPCYRCSLHTALAGCTGASTNCPAGSEPSACGAGGCQTCAAGTASPGGSQPCSTCPANTYAAQNPAVCMSCPAGYESLPGSTARAQCAFCYGQYLVTPNSTPSGLVGLDESCPSTTGTSFALCADVTDATGGTCGSPPGFGFRWMDTIVYT